MTMRLFWCLLLLLSAYVQPSHGFIAKSLAIPGTSVAGIALGWPSALLADGEELSSSEVTPAPGDDDSSNSKAKKKKKSRLVTIWVHAVSIFVVGNYRSRCWPGFLTSISLPSWTLVHALSGMVFAGSILTTTILEWIVVSSRERPVNEFWFAQVPEMEKFVVLPALTGSIVSGVAQAFLTYGSLRHAPRHVKSSLHVLLLFGMWWGVTDRRTQGKAQEAVAELEEKSELPSVISQRRISNVVSCCFLAALYAIMTLKPGYSGVV